MPASPAETGLLNESELEAPPMHTAAQLRAHLTDIERDMADVEGRTAEEMARLRNKKEATLQSLAAIVYPVLTLPPEVIAEIFLHYVHGRPSGHPPRLTRICSSWRAIAISAPGLWNRFVGGSATWDAQKLLRRFQMWLPRAGGLPLIDVAVTLPSFGRQDAALSSLAQYSSRWSTLELRSSQPIYFPADSLLAPLSSLKTLKLDVQWPAGSASAPCMTAFLDAPMLRDVCLRSGLPLTRVLLPWTQLTAIELWGQSVDEGLAILAQTSSLERLSCALHTWPTNAPAQPPVTLPYLRLLMVLCDGDLTPLGRLTLPALEHLEVYEISQAASILMNAFFERSQCSLRFLTLIQTSFTDAYECFWSLPSIIELNLQFCQWSRKDLNDFFEWISTNETLPGLETLQINQPEFDIDLRVMTKTVARRWYGVRGTAKLNTLRLSADRSGGAHNTVRAAPVTFPEWKAQGLDIETTNLPEWTTEDINAYLKYESARYVRVSQAATS
ncbi:hypothetical protein B0H15DRAFT_905141 [Mycena belliarum]|uniref:F-box domain-containing protein n=1 Tax=Mycena belliarum TaxID=1033014 RepID=A0AAD6U7S1_9AGAR|nr:hypothetical protein B0H15DRAFT_905141 [Mycena belliae]